MDDSIKNLPAYDGNALAIKPVFDPSTNQLHYQTDPYLDVDGKIKVKRIASYPVEVVVAGTVVSEYTGTTKY